MNLEAVSRSAVVFVIMLAMSVSASPAAIAQQVPLEAPDPATELLPPPREGIATTEAGKKLAEILKAFDEARRIADRAKRNAAIKDAKGKLEQWKIDHENLWKADIEREARDRQNDKLQSFIDRETAAKKETNTAKQLEALKGLHKDLESWYEANCTEEGQAKDGLITTTIHCNGVKELKARVWALILKKDPNITSVPVPTQFPVATTMPTSSPIPVSPLSIQSLSSSVTMTDDDVDVDILVEEPIAIVPATPTASPTLQPVYYPAMPSTF